VKQCYDRVVTGYECLFTGTHNPMHSRSQRLTQVYASRNASSRKLSRHLLCPKSASFYGKSTLITTSFPRSRYLRTKGVSADLRYIEQEVRINAIPPIFYRLKSSHSS